MKRIFALFILLTCATSSYAGWLTKEVEIGPDDVRWHLSRYAYYGDVFYDSETGAKLEGDDKRRARMSNQCNLIEIEEDWNCESVKVPQEHWMVNISKEEDCETTPALCYVQITIDRREQLVPFFPELEKQCLLDLAVVRKSAEYDKAYATALQEYQTATTDNPRTGNTIECQDVKSARLKSTLDGVSGLVRALISSDHF